VADPGGEVLAASYDLLMFDLDGVVYLEGHAVDHAARSIADSRRAGARIAFITNNAARTPEQVAEHLRDLGVDAVADDVVTSSQAAARVLLDRYHRGARVAVLGAEGLVEAVRNAGLEPMPVDADDVVAIVSGYAPQVRWKTIMRASVVIRNGLPWVATNTDPTLPTADGPAPGHGTLVKMISGFAGVSPQVAGKPERPLFDETLRRVGGERPLMVGDSLHTDTAGAHKAETDSLLVMTGVTGLSELVAAPPEQRPTWVADDLRALGRPGCTASRHDGRWTAGGWSATLHDGHLTVEGSGGSDGWWAAVTGAAWAHLDETGETADVSHLSAPDRAGSAG